MQLKSSYHAMNEPDQIPDYIKNVIHSYHRRAQWHDYKSPCVYHIILKKNPLIPSFSAINGNLEKPFNKVDVTLFPSGNAIAEACVNFESQYPFIRIKFKTIMPDHVHMIVTVTETIPYKLGHYLGILKGRCSRYYWNWLAENRCEIKRESLFLDNFTDKILLHKDQWRAWELYIADNPRRRFLTQQLPHLFERNILCYENYWFPCYGNYMIMHHPEKAVVKFRRKATKEEMVEKIDSWLSIATEGGVLVSPFIHPVEKMVCEKAIELGGKIIRVVENPFDKLEKPSKTDFNLCAEGRMLIVSLRKNKQKDDADMTYQRASVLNRMTSWLCSLDPKQISFKKQK